MPLFDTPIEFEKVVRQLRRTPTFCQVSRYDLARLLATASLQTVAAGQVICVPDTDPNALPSPSFYFLLTGEYDLDGGTLLNGTRDGLVGTEDVVRKQPRSITLTALSKGTYLEIKSDALIGLLQSSTPFRQALHPFMDLGAGLTTFVAPAEAGAKGSIVQFLTDIPDAPLSLLIELLAREVTSSFADYVLVLRPIAPGQSPSPSPVQVANPGLGGLYYLIIDPNDAPGVVATYGNQFDYVFLDGIPSDVIDVIVKLQFGYPTDYVAPPPVGSPRILQTVVIGMPPLPTSKELYYVNANPTGNSHSSDCRIRLDLVKLNALAQSWNPYMPNVTIDEGLAHEMGVWARALTHRRTGIALAGGGVWSMQSVFIIQELNRRGVPLDVITGASAGAMIGGYYSVLGLPGLDLLVERGDSGLLDVVVTAWMLAPCFGQALFDYDLGADTCLENLGVDFRPNSTNLTIGEGVAFIRGQVAKAVRAAASAPPLVAPTFSRSERFVDGAFSNNVAAQVLPYFGANLTFGANTYPPSNRPTSAWVPDIVTRVTSLGPLNRMFDFTVALNLLANLTGKVEAGYSDVAYNATSSFSLPFLFTTNFRLSSKMIEHASQDVNVLRAVDEYTMLWEHMRYRGRRSWTTTPP